MTEECRNKTVIIKMQHQSLITKILLVFILLTISTSVMARAFKWIDADGNVHYTSAPPPQAGQLQEIRIYLPPSKEEDDEEEETDADDEDAIAVEEEEKIAKNCLIARKNIPRVVRKMEQMAKQGLKSGKITKEKYDKFVAKKTELQKIPSQADCIANYSESDSNKNLVDCLASAEGDTSKGVNCMLTEGVKKSGKEAAAQNNSKE